MSKNSGLSPGYFGGWVISLLALDPSISSRDPRPKSSCHPRKMGDCLNEFTDWGRFGGDSGRNCEIFLAPSVQTRELTGQNSTVLAQTLALTFRKVPARRTRQIELSSSRPSFLSSPSPGSHDHNRPCRLPILQSSKLLLFFRVSFLKNNRVRVASHYSAWV